MNSGGWASSACLLVVGRGDDGGRRLGWWAARVLPFAVIGILALCACAQASGFGVEKWEAGTCIEESCTDAGAHSAFYTQAAGHPNFGITDFRFDSKASSGLTGTVYTPEGHVQNVRVDIPPGLSVNPEAAQMCTQAQLDESRCPAASKVGEDEATGTVSVPEALLGGLEALLPEGALVGVGPLSSGSFAVTVTERFPVYDMERREGEPARFAIEVKSATIDALKLESVTYLETGISWHHEPLTSEDSGVASGDFHEYFEIENIPTKPEIVESKLIFWGRPHEHNPAAPERAFLTMPSTCEGPQTSWLHVDSHEEPGDYLAYSNQTPVGASGCSSLLLDPQIAQTPETTQSDAPDGTTVTFTVPQATDEPNANNSPNPQTVQVTLPEGMTLNPSAANGLEGCTDQQIGIGTDQPIACPERSVIGTVTVDAPGIPNGSLTGRVYLGSPESGDPESGQMYRIFLAAEAPRYGVGVRLEGRVAANAQTGRLTATFSGLPQVPFERFIVKFDGGAQAPLANPLGCGEAITSAAVFPYSDPAAATQIVSPPFVVDADGKGGACPSPLPFSLAQGASASPSLAGASTSFALTLGRGEGQQYLQHISTTLPPGLLGLIPSVPLCGEPAASAGNCAASSAVGTASVQVGSGPEPYSLAGEVYLTGPYSGAPFGLSVVVPAEHVGPYDFGRIVTRAAITIDPYTARVTISSTLPTIIGGVPLRLRSLTVSISREGFMRNPTSCAPLSLETTLLSTLGASSALSSPFQVSGCESLPFSPTLAAYTSARTSRADGAMLEVRVQQPPAQASIRSVSVTLPRKLAARISTLKLACAQAIFASDPSSCPKASDVGSAKAQTPALPGVLEGPVYVVSHGGAAYPDLDVVLHGDGVTVILVGSTVISRDFTHSSFLALPDVPLSSFVMRLPQGRDSLLAANGRLCRRPLIMPVRIISQSGRTIEHRLRVAVGGCPIELLHKRPLAKTVLLRVAVPTAGSLILHGRLLRLLHRSLKRSAIVTLTARLTRRGLAALARGDRLKLRILLSFRPSKPGGGRSHLIVTARLPHRPHRHGHGRDAPAPSPNA